MALQKINKGREVMSGPKVRVRPVSPTSEDGPVSEKSGRAFRTIGEVSELLDLPQHVLRFWETRFTQIKPLKRGGNRRYYRPEDIDLLQAIKTLLYDEGITIKGVQKRFREQGVKMVVAETVGLSAKADKVAGQGAMKTPAAPQKSTAKDSYKESSAAFTVSAPAARKSADDTAMLKEILTELKALRAMLD